ncbi:MAG: hypothetical protein KUG79_03945 [Pseudomonadales bacterium]|nr:hypothetical protein [Pseudomonadales bacterium]
MLFGICINVSTQNSSAEELLYSFVINQGLVATSDNNFYGDSDDSISFQYTELSANGSYKINSHFRVAGQVLYRRAGETSDSVDIDYLFIDSQIFGSEAFNLGINLGRFKNPIGLYNDTRDVAFTRPGVFLPQGIYPDALRDIYISSDGALAYANLFRALGQWHIELAYGAPRLEEFGDFIPKSIDISDAKILLGRIIYEHDLGRWQLGLSYIRQTSDLSADNLNALSLPLPLTSPIRGDEQLEQYLFTAQYNHNTWTLTSEYARTSAGLSASPFSFASPAPPFDLVTVNLSTDFETESYYFQLQKQLNDRWSSLLRWDVLEPNKGNQPASFGNVSFGYIDSTKTEDLTLGLRWKIADSMMLSTEYHYIEGFAWVSPEDNLDVDLKSPWHMIALSFSYRF